MISWPSGKLPVQSSRYSSIYYLSSHQIMDFYSTQTITSFLLPVFPAPCRVGGKSSTSCRRTLYFELLFHNNKTKSRDEAIIRLSSILFRIKIYEKNCRGKKRCVFIRKSSVGRWLFLLDFGRRFWISFGDTSRLLFERDHPFRKLSNAFRALLAL